VKQEKIFYRQPGVNFGKKPVLSSLILSHCVYILLQVRLE
jgi:hypothetical protein